MGSAKSRFAYPVEQDFMTKVLEAEKGMTVKFGSGDEGRKKAWTFRFNCYAARRNDARHNAKNLAKEHPLHGDSVCGSISLTIDLADDNNWTVTATLRSSKLKDGAIIGEIT